MILLWAVGAQLHILLTLSASGTGSLLFASNMLGRLLRMCCTGKSLKFASAKGFISCGICLRTTEFARNPLVYVSRPQSSCRLPSELAPSHDRWMPTAANRRLLARSQQVLPDYQLLSCLQGTGGQWSA